MSKVIEKKRCDALRLKRDFERADAWSRQFKCRNCCSTIQIDCSDVELVSYYEGCDYGATCPVCGTREVLWFVPGYVKRTHDLTRSEYEQMMRQRGVEP